jgi:tRNA pseudouridine55 synthase
MVNGLLLLDKPSGMTSRDVVDRVQRWFPRGTKIGHTGTLDPLATGVLVICFGKATRLAEYVQRMAKTYRAGILLGSRSDTDDLDGAITPGPGTQAPERTTVAACLQGFVGNIEQVPPAFSAAKVEGRRAYSLARRGREVPLAARQVQIHGIDLLQYEYPRLLIEVRCGKGTYIRSLARDLGNRLGCGGLIETLRRSRVGPFPVENAVSLDLDPGAVRTHLLPLAAAVAELPHFTVADQDAARIRQGGTVSIPGNSFAEAAAFDENGELIAVVRWDQEASVFYPEKVISG